MVDICGLDVVAQPVLEKLLFTSRECGARVAVKTTRLADAVDAAFSATIKKETAVAGLTRSYSAGPNSLRLI